MPVPAPVSIWPNLRVVCVYFSEHTPVELHTPLMTGQGCAVEGWTKFVFGYEFDSLLMEIG